MPHHNHRFHLARVLLVVGLGHGGAPPPHEEEPTQKCEDGQSSHSRPNADAGNGARTQAAVDTLLGIGIAGGSQIGKKIRIRTRTGTRSRTRNRTRRRGAGVAAPELRLAAVTAVAGIPSAVSHARAAVAVFAPQASDIARQGRSARSRCTDRLHAGVIAGPEFKLASFAAVGCGRAAVALGRAAVAKRRVETGRVGLRIGAAVAVGAGSGFAHLDSCAV